VREAIPEQQDVMIITIDGPAGAGKSSAARLLAARLGFEFLDTGAMYRAVALAALRAGVRLSDDGALEVLLPQLRIEQPQGQVLLSGEDVSAAIRTAEVSEAASAVAVRPPVRHYLARRQRAIAQGRNMVCEGRDQGTVVFPEAVCKFFLVADARERARRRQKERAERGEAVDLEALLREQQLRDERDGSRNLAPMQPAADAIVLDSTHLSPEEVVRVMEAEVRRCSTR
jgi:cytidylate kinase